MEPTEAVGFVGVTEMDFSIAALTESVVDPVMPPDVAEIVVLCPANFAVANPPADIAAALVFEEAQVTDEVRSLLLLSE